jgi:hypothetical protein
MQETVQAGPLITNDAVVLGILLIILALVFHTSQSEARVAEVLPLRPCAAALLLHPIGGGDAGDHIGRGVEPVLRLVALPAAGERWSC